MMANIEYELKLYSSSGDVLVSAMRGNSTHGNTPPWFFYYTPPSATMRTYVKYPSGTTLPEVEAVMSAIAQALAEYDALIHEARLKATDMFDDNLKAKLDLLPVKPEN